MKKVMVAVAMIIMVCAQARADQVVWRTEVVEDKEPSYSLFLMDIPGGYDLRVHGFNTEEPLYRLGYMAKTSWGKVGGYFDTKGDHTWVNPSVSLAGKLLGGTGAACIDYYYPVDNGKVIFALSDSNLMWSTSKRVSLGVGANFSWTQGGKHSVKGSLVGKAKLGDNINLYTRFNVLGGGAPDSIRIDVGIGL